MKRFSLFRQLAMLSVACILFVGFTSYTAWADTLTYQPGPSQGKDVRVELTTINGNEVMTVENDFLLQVGTDPSTLHGFLIDVDMVGLPKVASKVLLSMVCIQTDESIPTTDYYIYQIYDAWDENRLTTLPKVYASPTSAPAPPAWYWINFDITSIYNARQAGTSNGKGLCFWAKTWNNKLSQFISSDYSDPTYRPKLTVTYQQPYQPPSYPTNIKMPLPSGKSWLLTTEIGGTDCRNNDVDEAHIGTLYYALDFAPSTIGGVYQSNVPVLATADGYVVEVGFDKGDGTGNGNYVRVNHSYTPSSGSALFNSNKGLVSSYLHFRDRPTLTKGTRVYQGTKLGVMGTTGKSTGVHIHFGLKFNGAGLGREELATIKMEGICFKQYQTECSGGTWNKYYPSTNVQR